MLLEERLSNFWKALWGVDGRTQTAFKNAHRATKGLDEALKSLDHTVTVVATNPKRVNGHD